MWTPPNLIRSHVRRRYRGSLITAPRTLLQHEEIKNLTGVLWGLQLQNSDSWEGICKQSTESTPWVQLVTIYWKFVLLLLSSHLNGPRDRQWQVFIEVMQELFISITLGFDRIFLMPGNLKDYLINSNSLPYSTTPTQSVGLCVRGWPFSLVIFTVALSLPLPISLAHSAMWWGDELWRTVNFISVKPVTFWPSAWGETSAGGSEATLWRESGSQWVIRGQVVEGEEGSH